MNNLHVDQLLIELLSLACVDERFVEGSLGNTKCSSTENQSFVVESLHEDVDTGAFVTHEATSRNLTVFENELSRLRPSHAHLVKLLGHRETWSALLNDECGDALVSLIHIGLGIDDDHIGARAIRDPHF